MDDRRSRIEQRGAAPGAEAGRWVERVIDPVVVILVLAGLFDGLSGNPLHATVLVGTGVGLVAYPPLSERVPKAPRGAWASRPWGRFAAVPVAVAYGTVVGAFQRYTWPVTVAVVTPGVVALVIASRTRPRAAPEHEERGGIRLWVAVLLALALFELLNFVLQPTRLVANPDHPTLSTLFNEVVVGHPSQAAALAVWLLVGWWLVER